MIESTKYYPLTSPQREIWFDQILHDEIPLYNIGVYVKITGAIDPLLFEQAINCLIQKHDTLRTTIKNHQDDDGIPMLRYADHMTVTMPVQDFSHEDEPHQAAMTWMQKRFVDPF